MKKYVGRYCCKQLLICSPQFRTVPLQYAFCVCDTANCDRTECRLKPFRMGEYHE
jgi:hypothetical protein